MGTRTFKRTSKNSVRRPHGILPDNLEQYALFLEEQSQKDKREQEYQINDMLYWVESNNSANIKPNCYNMKNSEE